MNKMGFDREVFKKSVLDNVKTLYRKTIDEATEDQVFHAVCYAVKDVIIDEWIATHKTYEKQDVKTVYYLSMEFLMGRALGNNIINICALNEVKEVLEELGFDLNAIEDREPDPAWKRRSWPSGSMFFGLTGYTGLRGVWMWYPLQVWNVCSANP